mgnify:FL=1
MQQNGQITPNAPYLAPKTTEAAPGMSSETRPLCLLPLQSMPPDCLPSSRAGTGQRRQPEIAIDAVESLVLTWSEGQGSAGD